MTADLHIRPGRSPALLTRGATFTLVEIASRWCLFDEEVFRSVAALKLEAVTHVDGIQRFTEADAWRIYKHITRRKEHDERRD